MSLPYFVVRGFKWGRCSVRRYGAAICIVACAIAAPGYTSALGATWGASSLNNPPGIETVSLEGVSCFSLTACTAVGKDGDTSHIGGAIAESFNGSGWTVETKVTRNPGPKNGVLRGVSCTAAATCLTTGAYGTSKGEANGMDQTQAGGNFWTLYAFEAGMLGINGIEMNAASCITTKWCMTVGFEAEVGDDHATAFEFNGSSVFRTGAIVASNSTFHGVACLSTTECLAVGSSGASLMAQHWNGGKTWIYDNPQPPTPTGSTSRTFTGISCVTTPKTCLASGYYTASGVVHPFADVWNGSSWAATTSIGASTTWAYGVSCVSSTECWLVGNSGTGAARKPWGALWNGSSWTTQTMPLAPGAEGAYLTGVSCNTVNRCRAVGSSLFGGTPIAVVESST